MFIVMHTNDHERQAVVGVYATATEARRHANLKFHQEWIQRDEWCWDIIDDVNIWTMQYWPDGLVND